MNRTIGLKYLKNNRKNYNLRSCQDQRDVKCVWPSSIIQTSDQIQLHFMSLILTN